MSDEERYPEEWGPGVVGPKKFAKKLRRLSKSDQVEAIYERDLLLAKMIVNDLQTIARSAK